MADTMRRTLYLETSFWSRLGDPPASQARFRTEAFLREAVRHHRVLVSRIVAGELWQTPDVALRDLLFDRMLASRAEILSYGRRARTLAWSLVAAGRWSNARFADMLHVAYTVLSGADALVTWDVRDLARDRTRTVVQAVARRQGLSAPLIGTPEEVMQWLDIGTR